MFGTACRVVGALSRSAGRLGFLVPAGRLALALGAVSAWVAVMTGSDADGVVGRTLCDPTVAKDHEQLAWAVAILFSAAIPADLALSRLPRAVHRAVHLGGVAAMAAALLVGSGLLAYTGHLGATLVYQQGAAVHQPSDTCAEFE
jgi:hypothetical protein